MFPQFTMYKAYAYKVSDHEITPTGGVEIYLAKSRDEAISHCLYTHRLHNGNAFATKHGVIHCPTCGQLAIVSQ